MLNVGDFSLRVYLIETDRVFSRSETDVSFVQHLRWKDLVKDGFAPGDTLTVKASITVPYSRASISNNYISYIYIYMYVCVRFL